jgi:hypothetical protein
MRARLSNMSIAQNIMKNEMLEKLVAKMLTGLNRFNIMSVF